MKPRILLVNPPIYDFSAYDFWLKPYGILSIGGFLRSKAEMELFDYLDRCHPALENCKSVRSDVFGRGSFYHRKIKSPPELAHIRRYYRRYGLERKRFRDGQGGI